MHIEPTARQLAAVIARKGKPSFAKRAGEFPGVERIEEGKISPLASGRLPHEIGSRPDLELRAIWFGPVVVVGGLSYDQDAENPLDNEGEGTIYRFSRFNGDNQEAFRALGLDSEGEPFLGHPAVHQGVVERVMGHINGDRNLLRRLERSMRRWGKKDPSELEGLIRSVCEGPAWPDDLSTELTREYCYRLKEGAGPDRRFAEDCEALSEFIEQARLPAWEQARSEGKVGNPLTVVLDVYEHSGIMFSVANHGVQCPWDTAKGGAIWVPDDVAHDCIMTDEDPRPKYELAKEYAESACEAYTAWCNGQTFVVAAFALDRHTGAILGDLAVDYGGVVGFDNAESEMEDAVLGITRNAIG